ncbi:MAG: ABC transporter permease [Bacteroidales bacterium]|nr:ABC transporter permease [Bacteroidales bacterium]MCF8405134.1 ABC transporter permease [Bacteroidales bacterium]
MIRNYLLSLYRNITRNKFYSILNIVGLSVGISAAIFILLYVQDELSYDKYNEKYERIYRVESHFTISGKDDNFAIVPTPMGPALKLEYPEVESFCRLYEAGNTLFRANDKEYYEDYFYFSDSTIFDIFTYELLQGDPYTCLTQAKTIVISEKIAKKYFGDDDPMGQILTSGSERTYKVTGVMKNQPGNSHLKFDALISGMSIAEDIGVDEFNSLEPDRFWNIGVYTFLLLNENASMQSIHDKFEPFYDKYMKPIGEQINASFTLMSTPLAETHFKQGLGAELPSGNKSYVFIFSAVALFLILIAAINYMNMATARSANRAKEVGVRKVLGAFRGQLIRQFISESISLSIIALLIAILIVTLLIPDFNTLTGKNLSFRLTDNPLIFIEVILIALITGFISGSYPAFYLSSFLPVRVLKGSVVKSGQQKGMLRKVLVVLQFFIAIFMIIGTIVVSSQIRYLKNKDLGFDKEALLVMEIQDTNFRNKIEVFKNELLNNPDVLSATNSTGVPGRINWIQVLKFEEKDEMVDRTVMLAQVDYDFAKTMGFEFVLGRDFDRDMGTDKEEAVIINEMAVKEFGWEENPLGKKIHYGWELDGSGGNVLKVVGVVKDFHFRSLHNKIEPVIFFISPRPRYLLSVRINPERKKETIEFIESKWNSFNARRPFDYSFLDEQLDEQYEAEEKISRILTIATLLTIFIALLGLLGLSSFIAEQRTKEIGIRKVVGASIGNILQLLYREFIILITIAFILAIPVAWWRLDIWLESSFVYYQSVQWTSFVIAGLLSFVIGMGTISFYIFRAATSNPVDSIKYE